MNPTVSELSVGRAPKPLRTVYCTRGGLFGALVLARLRACAAIEICAIVRSSRTVHPALGFLGGAFALIGRSGIAYSMYLLMATTIADVLCGLSRMGGVPVRTRAAGLPVHTTRNINQPEAMRFLANHAPDLLVSAFFDQRLHEPALSIPLRGCLNIHPSLLPSFKGVDPVLQARLQRATSLGVSVHRMSPELDAGKILAQRSVLVPDGSSIFAATALLYRSGADLLSAAIDNLQAANDAEADSRHGSYQSWPSRLEVRALHKLGDVLIRLGDFSRLLADET